jgi:peptide/nickel transport system ATP-binding protein
MGSIPRRGAGIARGRARGRLQEIAGLVPSLREDIPGCPFAPRCGFAVPRCATERPVMAPLAPPADATHAVACWEAARVAAASP